MRELTNHIVPGDSANHQLKVAVLDEPGQGGGCHLYLISGFHTESNPSENDQAYDGAELLFQNRPINEGGVNGLTHETLLAVLIDRLYGFQSGPFECEDNAEALRSLKHALRCLQRRTEARIARGVEGTHQQ